MVNHKYGIMESLVELKDISVTFKMGGLRKRGKTQEDLSIYSKRVRLIVGKRRFGCLNCDRVFTESFESSLQRLHAYKICTFQETHSYLTTLEGFYSKLW